MPLILRDGYSTVISGHTFESTVGQFGTDQDRLEYSRFFGLGGGADDPFTVPFDWPLALSLNLPFVGETELFSARLFGEIGATFGLQVYAALNNGAPDPADPGAPPTGTITSVLPYRLGYAFPRLDPVDDAGELITLHLGNSFVASAEAGFTTLFPRLEFRLELVAELSAEINASVGALGESTTFTVLDFAAATVYELLSIDTGRRDAEGERDPVNVLGGTTTGEIIDDIEWLDPFYDREGEFAGVEIPFNQFFSNPETADNRRGETEVEGTTEPEDEEEKPEDESDPPDPAGLDLGSLRILVPNINTASKYVDGVFVTDPTVRVVDGEVIDDLDADGFPQARGNRGDIAVLTVDIDGLVTYATGGAFPPMEYTFEQIKASIADILTLTADFSYNLFDVELVASLPLVQDFTVTPELGTRLHFYEVDAAGGKGAAKPVEIVQLERVLLFDENGLFQSAAVAERLAELAETSTVRVAQDVDQFVDFEAGIPGAFTGQTASIGGRVVVREGTGAWRELFTNADDPIARSAPALGQDQLAPLDISNLSFGYKIFRDDDPLVDFEIVEFDFDDAASIFRSETREIVAPLTVTPYLSSLDALNLRYDGDDTFVEVEHRVQPIITNRTGLEFDLELVLSAMAMTAEFGAYVDLGFMEVGGSLGFDFGPLWRERFPLFNADLMDFFNEEFQAYDDETTHIESFVLGAAPPEPDYGDAIVGTDGAERLVALPAGSSIVPLGGDDTVIGGAGNDTIFMGAGANTIVGGGGYDTLDLGMIETPLVTNTARADYGQRIGAYFSIITLPGLPDWGQQQVYRRDGTGNGVDRAANDIHVFGIDEVLFTDAADNLFLLVDGTAPTFKVPERFDLRGGHDRASIEIGHAPLEWRGLHVLAGEGDDTVGLFVNSAEIGNWSNVIIDGGAGLNTLQVDADFDLSRPVGEQGALGAEITNFTNLTAWANYVTETIPAEEGGGTRNVPLNYRLTGDGQANRIEGAIFDDTLNGGDGNDTLIGGDGNDQLTGGSGADEMRGGVGIDVASYWTAPTSVFIDLDFHGDGIGRGFRGVAQGDVLTDIETVIGSAHDDILIGAPGMANTLMGGPGNDRLMAKGYDDTLIGGGGDDLLAAGGTIFSTTTPNNSYDGGAGFDFLALQTFDPVTVTGTLTGRATYSYLTGSTLSSSTSTSTRNVTVDYRYERTGHVKATLDEEGNGTVEYWRDDASGRVQATGLSGTAIYSDRPDASIIDWFPGYFTKTSSFDYNITPITIDKLLGRSISFSKSGDNPNGSGSISSVPSAPTASRGGLQGTETFTGIEGLIGTAGDDFLTGNSQANGLYGNGGWDLIQGGGDGNLMGFGEGQKIADIFSFPGRPSGGSAPVILYPTMEGMLSAANPYGTEADGGMPVGRIRIGSSLQTDRSQVVGSMLWGQGHDNTLDMRFDRGISFFPDRSTNWAVVNLNIAGDGAPINFYTGEQVMYGRAEWRSESGALLSFAHTFGVHNVIGSQMNDQIYGDRADNVIEGMDGRDFMDGSDGTDTLAYGRAPEGVQLNMIAHDEGLAVYNIGTGGEIGTGHARGDQAYGFEHFFLSDHDDEVLIGARTPLTSTTVEFGGGARVAEVPVATLATNPQVFFNTGAGDDHLEVIGGPRIAVRLGTGDDTATIAGPGHRIFGDGGDDVFTIVDTPSGQLSGYGSAARTTRIGGGPGMDTVILDGDQFLGLTLTATGAVVTQASLHGLAGTATQAEKASLIAASQPIGYELHSIEFLEMGGERIRLAPRDPVTGADRTLRLQEDARAAFGLDAKATTTEIEAGVLFEVVALPEGAVMLRPNGNPLEIGDLFSAVALEMLRVLPGQDYDQSPGEFVYAELAANAIPRSVTLPLTPPIQGVSLGLETPVDPLGGDMTITVTELPDHGVVFYRTPDPDLEALGVIRMIEVEVALGDHLTPEQIAGLHYRQAQDATGAAGAFAYVAEHGEGLREIGGLGPVTLADGLELADYDGSSAQRVAIVIAPVDDAPRVSRLLFPISPGGDLTGRVAATDPEGDDFTLELVEGPGRGTLSFNADGTFRYVQNTAVDFAGAQYVEEIFTVRAVQSANGLASAAREQVIRIVNPAFLGAIVFDPTRPDVFFESDGTPIKLGGLGTDDTIIGAAGIDNELFGFGGNDNLRGMSGNNLLEGGEGDDLLEGGSGADTLDGGAGSDTADYVGAAARVFVDLVNRGSNTGDAAGDSFISIENIRGSLHSDDLRGDDGANLVNGSNGHDFIMGRGGADILIGGNGNDTLIGGDGNDVLSGGDGRNVLNGGAGNDRLVGGVGNDRLIDTAGDNSFIAGGGDDVMFDGRGASVLYGGAGRDRLIGSSGNDRLLGGSGNDVMNGGNGNDRLAGHEGNDYHVGGNGADIFVFQAGMGADWIQDFELGLDRLFIDNALTGGQTDEATVVARFATVAGGNVVFDFGGGNTVELLNLSSTAGLDLDMLIT